MLSASELIRIWLVAARYWLYPSTEAGVLACIHGDHSSPHPGFPYYAAPQKGMKLSVTSPCAQLLLHTMHTETAVGVPGPVSGGRGGLVVDAV